MSMVSRVALFTARRVPDSAAGKTIHGAESDSDFDACGVSVGGGVVGVKLTAGALAVSFITPCVAADTVWVMNLARAVGVPDHEAGVGEVSWQASRANARTSHASCQCGLFLLNVSPA